MCLQKKRSASPMNKTQILDFHHIKLSCVYSKAFSSITILTLLHNGF